MATSTSLPARWWARTNMRTDSLGPPRSGLSVMDHMQQPHRASVYRRAVQPTASARLLFRRGFFEVFKRCEGFVRDVPLAQDLVDDAG